MLILLPPSVNEGDEVSVVSSSGEFVVTVPRGCRGGDEVDVLLPVAEDAAEMRGSPTTIITPATTDEIVDLSDGGHASPPSSRPKRLSLRPPPISQSPSISPSIHRPIATPSPGSSLGCSPAILATISGATPSPISARAGRSCLPGGPTPPTATTWGVWCVGMSVETRRSDGCTWSRATIGACDYASGTFTVVMDDGRLKYLVEEADLRCYRCGAYNTGDAVNVRPQGSGSTQPAAVVGYDEESETYTVLHPDGRRSYFVSEEMIEKRR